MAGVFAGVDCCLLVVVGVLLNWVGGFKWVRRPDWCREKGSQKICKCRIRGHPALSSALLALVAVDALFHQRADSICLYLPLTEGEVYTLLFNLSTLHLFSMYLQYLNNMCI